MSGIKRNKKLSYRRGTARCVVSVEILPIIIIIIVNSIYIAQVCKGHKCAMSAEIAVRLRLLNCLCLYS